jgi:flagellar motility protein MotE (MotC chaperone)
MKSLTQVFLAALVILKIFICAIYIFQVEMSPLFGISDAMASEPTKSADARPANITDNSDDEKINVELVVQKMNHLKEKEKSLEKKTAELAAFQIEIDQKIELLTKLRSEIKSQMVRKETIEKQKIKHLIKAYAAMKPQSAAELIERLDRPFAIELLSNMKGEVVGQILTYVERDKAADLIEGLAKRK